MKKLLLLFIFLFTLVTPAHAEEAKGVIIIPSIDLNEPITTIKLVDNQFDTSNMEFAGWVEGTSWVNTEWGRTVIIGHTPGAFMNVHNIQKGDSITVLSEDTPYYYEVFEIIPPTNIWDVHWIMPTDVPTLTIITCEGDLRRIVNASLKDS